MAVNFEVEDGIIALQMIGVYAPDDIKQALLTGLEHSRSSPSVGLMFDVSRSASLRTRSSDDVIRMGYFLAQHADAFARRVALVAFDDFPFGMMRMGQVILQREGVTAEVFREEKNAREWLHAP